MATKMRMLSAIAVVVTLALAGCTTPEGNDAPETFEVTIDNLSDGQIFSPGVVVTHTSDATVWAEGQAPSAGVIAIAEDGNSQPAVDGLRGSSGVVDVVNTEKPINRNGGPEELPGERTFTIDADGATHLSVAVMTICTNDGFAGVDSLELPSSGETATHRGGVFDAGSEENTEAFPDIVDPCQAAGPVQSEADGNNDDLPEDGGVIQPHEGIQGVADLTKADHGWSGQDVVEITVTPAS